MINDRSGPTGHRTLKSRDININTGSTNRNVILQVVKSLPEKYESKVIECSVSDGDFGVFHKAQVAAEMRFNTVSCPRPWLSRGGKKNPSGIEFYLLMQWLRYLVNYVAGIMDRNLSENGSMC